MASTPPLCQRCEKRKAVNPDRERWLTADVKAKPYLVHVAFVVRPGDRRSASPVLCLECHREVIGEALERLRATHLAAHDARVPLNCPKCPRKMAYVTTDGDTHVYKCLEHGHWELPPDGRLRQVRPQVH
jgi:hypothetical protein